MFLKIKKFYPPVIEILPLFLLFYTVFLLNSNYGQISNGVPVNFSITGIPTAWGDKTALIILGVVAIGVYFLLSFISYKFLISPEKLIIINKNERLNQRKLSSNELETIRVFAVRGIFIIKSLVGLLLLYIYKGIVRISLGHQVELGLTLWLIVGLIIFVVIIMTSKIYSIKGRTQ